MKKKVIVCVDDEITVLTSLKIELKTIVGNEYAIEIAEEPEEALDLIQELQSEGREIPLIISDYLMPKMKGDEVLRRVHELSPATLKVMLTGQANIEAIANAINYAKLYRYLAKPWQPEDLMLTVKEALNSYDQQQKIAEKNAELLQLNQALETLTQEQAALIAKLHEEEKRLKQFLDAMPLGVFVVDNRGNPYYINSRGEELLGKAIVEVENPRNLREIYQVFVAGTSEVYPIEREPIFCALQGESVNIDDMEIRRLDKAIPLEVWGTPIYDEKGNIIYAIAAFTDITERKKAETERSDFTQQLAKLNFNLQKALETELELTQAASRFVPNQFLSFLGYGSLISVKLGDAVEKEMSILFCDIRDFTTLSEQMTPKENFKFINSYLSRMEPAIIENNGFIDKYIGDAIMALFGESADDAVKAGISMLRNLHQYNRQRGLCGYAPINIGIGINTGSLMLGIVGGKNRLDGTVIGDAVNLAARVETLTKTYGVSLLITQQTFQQLEDTNQYAIRLLDKVKVKGKSENVSLFEVFDADEPEIRTAKLVTRTEFEKGVLFYHLKNYHDAVQCFEKCRRQNPGDVVVERYLERCEIQMK